MKVLFCLIDMNMGGTEKSFLNLVESLPENYQIDLLLLREGGKLLDAVPPRVTIMPYFKNSLFYKTLQETPLNRLKKLYKKKLYRRCFVGAFNYLKYKLTDNGEFLFKILDELPVIDKKYDVAVAFAGPHNFISYYIGQKIYANKKIQWIHFDVLDIPFDIQSSKKLYEHFDEIKVVSNIAKINFLKVLPQFSDRTTVFHNILNKDRVIFLSENNTAGFDDGFSGTRILTVGRVNNQKGYDFAIPAIKLLVESGYNIRYYIIGEGGRKDELQMHVINLQLENVVFFLGSKSNPYVYMKQTDIYLQPSRHEGQGMTVEEAKLFNKPIILTNYSVASESVVDGETGLIVEKNSNAIFTGIKLLLDDVSLRQRFANNLKRMNLEKENETVPF